MISYLSVGKPVPPIRYSGLRAHTWETVAMFVVDFTIVLWISKSSYIMYILYPERKDNSVFVIQLSLPIARLIFLFSELRTKFRSVCGSDLISIVGVCE